MIVRILRESSSRFRIKYGFIEVRYLDLYVPILRRVDDVSRGASIKVKSYSGNWKTSVITMVASRPRRKCYRTSPFWLSCYLVLVVEPLYQPEALKKAKVSKCDDGRSLDQLKSATKSYGMLACQAVPMVSSRFLRLTSPNKQGWRKGSDSVGKKMNALCRLHPNMHEKSWRFRQLNHYTLPPYA